MASTQMSTIEAATPSHDGSSPNGIATSDSTTACTPIVTMLESVRPRISDSRRAGVTRWRSITPSRSSWMIPKPAKPAPKMASCMQQARHEDPPRVVAAEPAAA